jgi:pilus assembly protein CpaC
MKRIALVLVALQAAALPGLCALAQSPKELVVQINKSEIIESPSGIKRIAVSNPDMAEAVAVSKTELLVNGKAPGETSLVIWDAAGERRMYDVHIVTVDSRPEAVRAELLQQLPGQDVTLTLSGGSVFLRGTVNDTISADRAVALAGTLGKVINLLLVKVPEAEPQILLKVRFANVDRKAMQQLGANIFSTGATNTVGTISTGQFGAAPTFDFQQHTITMNDVLNVFLFRPDLNLGATIQALETKQLVQILAEPNLMAVSGRPASFLAGGEFPYPTVTSVVSGVGQVSVQFREFGVRIHFLPTITPRGTIRLAVTPEVSSLDYANGLTLDGYTVPGLSTRRVQTEVELENEQSFVIAGLLDNRTTENLNKIPGLSSIPVLGKLFESRSLQKNNTELMVLVTPELVHPIPAGGKAPEVKMETKKFLKDAGKTAPQNPTDPTAKLPSVPTIPIEVLKSWSEPDAQPANPPVVPFDGSGELMPRPKFEGTNSSASAAAAGNSASSAPTSATPAK